MGIRVMIADDSETTRRFLERSLKMVDPELLVCAQASNGHEALAALEDTWVDMIFVDLHMPGMDGREFLKRVRESDLWRNIPVAIVTSERSDETEVELFEMGASYYQKKPLTPEVVKEMLSVLKEMMP